MGRHADETRGPGAARAGTRSGAARAGLAAGFVFGTAFGLALGAIAYFVNFGDDPGALFSYAVRLTGHRDLAEDLIWLFSGGFIGAMIAAWAAWRAERRRADGIGTEHVLNRTFRVLDGEQAPGAPDELPHRGKTGNRDRG